MKMSRLYPLKASFFVGAEQLRNQKNLAANHRGTRSVEVPVMDETGASMRIAGRVSEGRPCISLAWDPSPYVC